MNSNIADLEARLQRFKNNGSGAMERGFEHPDGFEGILTIPCERSKSQGGPQLARLPTLIL